MDLGIIIIIIIKSKIRDKQTCLLSIIFEVENTRDQLWKIVTLNSFQKP